MNDARALAPVSESTELTVAEAADALSREFQNESSPVESRPLAVEEKKEADPPALSDQTKVTLKDGAELSIQELKRGYISRKSFTQKTQALADERARFEELRVQTQHYARACAEMYNALEIAAHALMPQQPDRSMVDVDPQTWKALQDDYEFKVGLLAQAQQAAQAQSSAAQAARNAEERDSSHRWLMARQQQREALFEAMPELTNANEARRFQEDAIDTIAGYGFSVEELSSSLEDLRNFRIVRDLIRYRKALQSAPKLKGNVAGLPVLTGKKRMDRAERSTRANRTQFEQFRNTGRLDDAAAILAKRMKD
ncbi:hypothetical protein [Bradyrhizobium retamae]|uniref:Uncharacterized protein n=1 Tax=Bradyrhizobium retamae TaxID=1300035 RepID=A0A0R3MKA4_9BRAD|nr:hypothetical protein [Bradyrhizobium retamae]KRR20369.1 hypothetical protein CQ13_32515 [Bradyrhizobium retamae]